MDPTLLGLLGSAAISSAASMANNAANIRYAGDANEESIALANTAHQREVRDLLAAGLNPILSASSNGSATPQLKVPNLESIDGGIGHSAGSIARALNGQMQAEAEMAKEDASSAASEAEILRYSTWPAAMRSGADTIDEAARMAAYSGKIDPHVSKLINWDDDDAVAAWTDLVQKYRNKADLDRYINSKEHAVFQDVLNSAKTAAELKTAILAPSRPSNRRSQQPKKRRHN